MKTGYDKKLNFTSGALAALSLFTLLTVAVPLSVFAKTVTLTVGLTEERPVPNMPQNLSEDLNYNRNIVKISVAKNLKIIRFEPLTAGHTNFILRDDKGKKIADFDIVVSKNNLNHVASEMKSLLGDIEGISVKIVNGKVVIDGEILLPKDMNRIYNVVAQFPDTASSIVTMSPIAQKKISELIEKDIGNPEIHVRSVNDKFILEGVAGSESEKTKAEYLAKIYVPDVVVDSAESAGIIKKRKIESVINFLSVKPGPEAQPSKTIKLVVHYVELNKDYSRSFNFGWTPTLNDNTQITVGNSSDASSNPGSGLVTQITATVSNLLPKLNYGKSHGHARILKSSSLIVQDGELGTLDSTVNEPISTQNQFGVATTSFVPVGFITKIRPKLLNAKSDNITLNMDFELSTLSGTSAQGPIINTNKLKTVIIVHNNQSAAVGGIVSNTNSTDYNRLPASNTSPIFSLYASKAFQSGQTQFVIFVTPVILNSASEGSDSVQRKFRLKE